MTPLRDESPSPARGIRGGKDCTFALISKESIDGFGGFVMSAKCDSVSVTV